MTLVSVAISNFLLVISNLLLVMSNFFEVLINFLLVISNILLVISILSSKCLIFLCYDLLNYNSSYIS